MFKHETAPKFDVVQAAFDGGGSLVEARVTHSEPNYPKILSEKARLNFPLIEDMLKNNGYEIPENWQVGDMLAFLITRYIKILDKNTFRIDDIDSEELKKSIFTPVSYNSGQITALSFEVLKPGATYWGDINISNDDLLNDRAGLPVNLYKRTEIPLSLRKPGQAIVQTKSLGGFEFFERPHKLSSFAKEVILPAPALKFSLS